MRTIDARKGQLRTAAFSPDGSRLATLIWDGQWSALLVFDPRTDEDYLDLPRPPNPEPWLAFAGGGRRLVNGSRTETVVRDSTAPDAGLRSAPEPARPGPGRAGAVGAARRGGVRPVPRAAAFSSDFVSAFRRRPAA